MRTLSSDHRPPQAIEHTRPAERPRGPRPPIRRAAVRYEKSADVYIEREPHGLYAGRWTWTPWSTEWESGQRDVFAETFIVRRVTRVPWLEKAPDHAALGQYGRPLCVLFPTTPWKAGIDGNCDDVIIVSEGGSETRGRLCTINLDLNKRLRSPSRRYFAACMGGVVPHCGRAR